MQLDGYAIGERVHSTPHSQVYLGERQRDGLRVAIKIYARQGRIAQRSRAVQEYELLGRIAAPGVARAVALEQLDGCGVVVVERFDGVRLSSWRRARARIATREFLALAVNVVQSLSAVHEARIVHKDVKLANLLVNPATLQVCLIDFGLAAELGRAQQAADGSLAEGSLHYIAPEQTGRVGAGIDFRTDLYSLGASLYELFTGERPFASRSPLELIHAHLASIPPAPHERAPEIPLLISQLIMRLLEKDPERRYQTAQGLLADLRACQDQLERTGTLDPGFALGAQDASDRLHFSQVLYGRETEAAQLQAAFDRAAQGSRELLWIEGPPGIGKSSLSALLRPRLLETHAYVARGKFDLDRCEIPYSGVCALARSLIDQILTERGERLQEWQIRLRVKLGRIGGALLELVPYLALVIDDFPAVPELASAEARERLVLALNRFLSVFAQRGCPLVLLLDDLQWADAGSLLLLENLLCARESEALLVICTARSEEGEGPRSPALNAWLERLRASLEPRILRVEPLGAQDTNALLADVLGRDPEQTRELAELVSRKTLNNPLLVRRLLEHLCELGLLRYVHRTGWVWDPQRLAEIELSDDAAEMMLAKLERLDPRARACLTSAAVVGNAFDLDVLAEVVGGDRFELLKDLTALVGEGVLAPCREGFKFAHDRIRETALAIPSPEARAAIHARVARLLIGRTPEAQLDPASFEIADHLNQVLQVGEEAERLEALEMNLRAGRRALRSGAAGTASHYLGEARARFRADDWLAHGERSFELFLRSAESALQSLDLAGALEHLSVLEQEPLTQVQLAQTLAKKIRVLILRQQLGARSVAAQRDLASDEDPLRVALGAFRRFGVRWPRDPSRLHQWLQTARTDGFLLGRLDERLCGPAQREHPRELTLHLIGTAAILPLTEAGFGLFTVGLALRNTHRYGYVAHRVSPGYLLAGYAAQRIQVLRSLRGAARYTRAAIEWLQRVPHPQLNVNAEFILLALIHAWTQPRRTIAARLKKLVASAQELGDVVLVTLTARAQIGYAALAGEPLEVVVHELGELAPRDRVFSAATRAIFARLQDPSAAGMLVPEVRPADLVRDVRLGPMHCVLRLMALCFLREHGAACQLAAEMARVPYPSLQGATVADEGVYRGLAIAASARRDESIAARWRRRRALGRCLRQARRWARTSKEFVHMASLLQAEHAWLRAQRPALVLALYERAAQQAEQQGHVHHAALALERAADLLAELRRLPEAVEKLGRAARRYEQWGALAKVEELRERARELAG